MLFVATLEQAIALCREQFGLLKTDKSEVSLSEACGRVLCEDALCTEYIPGFDRSTVDGLAVFAADTHGCSDTLPAQLLYRGDIPMGSAGNAEIRRGECMSVATGGALPINADAVVMVEHTEDYGDGMRYVLKPAGKSENLVRAGDDAYPGKLLVAKDTLLRPKDIGALSAAGLTRVPVYALPRVGIVSTGDELVPSDSRPLPGQVRDVNAPMLGRAVAVCPGEPVDYGITPDNKEAIIHTLLKAVEDCDIVLLSGGSSAGEKDMTAEILAECGEVHVHGLAVKPGKPTVLGAVDGKPVIGLPGHPVSAYFVFLMLAAPLIRALGGYEQAPESLACVLGERLPSNHGREEFVPVVRRTIDGKSTVFPVAYKSGLITLLCAADGFVRIPRDCEGFEKGATVEVFAL